MEPIQIVLADEHRLFRSGLAALIKNFSGYNVVFEAANSHELMRMVLLGVKPHIGIIDINMPAVNGIDTVKWLKNTYPGIGVIVLSTVVEAERVLDMLKLGVKGYLLRDAEPAEFETALAKVSRGEVYYPEFVTRLLVNTVNHGADSDKLNAREIEFLKLAATELTHKEIALQMGISVRTVDGYRDILFKKLRVKNRIGLVLYAVKNKLIDL